MKKVKNFIINKHMDILIILFICYSLYLTFFYFIYAGFRIKESLYDILTTFINYGCKLLGVGYNGVSVIEFTEAPFRVPFNLPQTWDEFKEVFSDYWVIFFNFDTFKKYALLIADISFYISQIILILSVPITLMIVVKIVRKPKINNDYNKQSKGLILFLKIQEKVFIPFILWLKLFWIYFKNHKYYKSLLILIWLWNFNVFTIIIETFAYYFYFVASLDFVHLYVQIIKLLMDLSVVFDFIPVVIWICIILKLIDKLRKSIGFDRLEHMELKNRGYINERPIISFYYGTVGTGKTKISTDNAISIEMMFRDKALDLMLECDLKFPEFSWINLELALQKAIESHEVYHLESARRFINKYRKLFYENKLKENIFDYDFENKSMVYDDGTHYESIWKVIKDYAQLYFIYIIESSLILSNYSIRVDSVLESEGNFPLWDNDIFKRTPAHVEENSRYSHILIMDILRLGKLVTNSEFANAFEFGVVVISEIGKERKNALELQVVKALDDLANQKNDLFNHRLKFIRHSCTIMHFCFCKIIVDDQRPESWGADARDLCEIIYINEVKKKKLAMPLFAFGELIHSLMFRKYKDNYTQHRYYRGDHTLFSYLYHNLASYIYYYYDRIYKQFGYDKLELLVESGRMDDRIAKEKTYFMSNKKISYRYSTDCYSSLFGSKARKSKYGLDDIPEYKGIVAHYKEMDVQGSYMFREMTSVWKVDDDEFDF